MRKSITGLALLLFALAPFSFSSTQVTPTTTLSAQTGNNTSTANSFYSQSNGNIGAGNVSKISIRSLLYPGASTKIYAHLMPWFGYGSHMNVGYSSNNASQVQRQVADMISRGINGVMIDWYGPGSFSDSTTKAVMAEAERHPGFTFAIVIDKGAIPVGCSNCSAQQALTDELLYIAGTYFNSPAYMRVNGRPVVTNFDLDLHYSLNWTALIGVVPGNPLYIFQHSGGFTHPVTSGSYSWVILSSDYGMSYLTNFYNTGIAHSWEDGIGAVYKGFNDTLASWGSRRIMSQQCGQTWLQTFAKINSMYNSGRQLNALQLVTWNDYEEGTELESGIDNCFSISASLSGATLNWKISGNENTVDHYTVYVSKDGQSLMALATLGRGNRSVNLSSYSLAAGKYTFYVQAVGRASIRNHMSGAVTYSASGTTATKSSGLELGATPSTLTLSAGQSASVQVTARATSGSVSAVTLSCSNLPAGTQCAFSPASVTPGKGSAASSLTISLAAVSAGARLRVGPVYALWLSGFGFAGLVVVGDPKRRRHLLALAVLIGLLVLCSCGGGGMGANMKSANQATPFGTYNVMVTGTSGGIQNSTSVTLTLR